MLIVAGKHGDFCGSQETIFKARDIVTDAVENCKTFKGMFKFIIKLIKERELRRIYASAFSLIYMLYDYTDEQKKCYNRIKYLLK